MKLATLITLAAALSATAVFADDATPSPGMGMSAHQSGGCPGMQGQAGAGDQKGMGCADEKSADHMQQMHQHMQDMHDAKGGMGSMSSEETGKKHEVSGKQNAKEKSKAKVKSSTDQKQDASGNADHSAHHTYAPVN